MNKIGFGYFMLMIALVIIASNKSKSKAGQKKETMRVNRPANKKKGSAGSHNGMKSVVGQLQSQDFPRIRIGIGKSGGLDWKDFVTGKVGKQERDVLAEAIARAADAAECIIDRGIDRAMNEYNIKPESERRGSSDEKGND